MSIEELLQYKNYNVEKETFKYICENLPVSKIQFDIYQNCFGNTSLTFRAAFAYHSERYEASHHFVGIFSRTAFRNFQHFATEGILARSSGE